MPVTRNPSGSTTITGNAILGMRGIYCLQALKMYRKHGMLLTRGATPKNMLRIAAEFTGKTYKSSQKGQDAAIADLESLIASNDGNLDKLGDTRAVNAAVGGVAADL